MNASEKPKSLREMLDEFASAVAERVNAEQQGMYRPGDLRVDLVAQATVEAGVLDALVRAWDEGWMHGMVNAPGDREAITRAIIEGRDVLRPYSTSRLQPKPEPTLREQIAGALRESKPRQSDYDTEDEWLSAMFVWIALLPARFEAAIEAAVDDACERYFPVVWAEEMAAAKKIVFDKAKTAALPALSAAGTSPPGYAG